MQVMISVLQSCIMRTQLSLSEVYNSFEQLFECWETLIREKLTNINDFLHDSLCFTR